MSHIGSVGRGGVQMASYVPKTSLRRRGHRNIGDKNCRRTLRPTDDGVRLVWDAIDHQEASGLSLEGRGGVQTGCHRYRGEIQARTDD